MTSPRADMAGRTHVLVLGAGPLGCQITEGLLKLGVRHIVVVDASSVSPFDVDGCYFSQSDVGVRGCAEVLANRYLGNSDLHILALKTEIRRLEGWRYDLVLSCSRTVEDRLRINGRIRGYHVPLIDGVASGSRGRVQVVLPYGPCLGCVLSARSTSPLEPADPEVVSAVAERMLFEAMRIIGGEQDECTEGIVYINGPDLEQTTLALGVSATCPLHGDEKWRRP